MPMQFPLILAILIQLLPPVCFDCNAGGCGSGVADVRRVEGCGCCGGIESGATEPSRCRDCSERREGEPDGRQPLIPSGDTELGVTLALLAGAPVAVDWTGGGVSELVSWGCGADDRVVAGASEKRARLCCWTT